MRIAVTGATGFLGRYIATHLVEAGHECQAWYRATSNREGLPEQIHWVEGELGSVEACQALVQGCDAVVHAALHHDGTFRGGEGDLVEFVEKNVVGTMQLIEAARGAKVNRFVFISTCAVHEEILPDRPLDEAHPLWPTSHYGAHKAALEKFVHSYGLGEGYPICALRPTGIYGLAYPPAHSKWYSLVRSVVRGEPVQCDRGGKEVHAADVAKASAILLTSEGGIRGGAFNCYDMYISQYQVAQIAQRLSGSASKISGHETSPKHQIETGKLRALGMKFGGPELLERTIAQLVSAAKAEA